MAQEAVNQDKIIDSTPLVEFPALDLILESMKKEVLAILPDYTDKKKLDDWYIGLFRARSIKVQDLISGDENNPDVTRLTEFIFFIEHALKILRTCHAAADTMKTVILKNASSKVKEAIAKEDRKYKPVIKVEEKEKVEKLSDVEKMIRKNVKLLTSSGKFTEEEARKKVEAIIYGLKK